MRGKLILKITIKFNECFDRRSEKVGARGHTRYITRDEDSYPRLGGLIGAVAASLHQSNSNARSEPCLGPTPQLTATPDP